MKTSKTNTELSSTTWLDLMVNISNGTENEFLNSSKKNDEPTAPVCELV